MNYQVLSLILGIILFLVIVVSCFINFRLNKMLKASRNRVVEGVREKDGVRYTEGQEIYDNDGEARVSLSQKDVILKVGETYTVSKQGPIKPGKYTLLTTNDDNTAFNIRRSSLVREYHHGDSIVLAEGDSITAVSHTVILR